MKALFFWTKSSWMTHAVLPFVVLLLAANVPRCAFSELTLVPSPSAVVAAVEEGPQDNPKSGEKAQPRPESKSDEYWLGIFCGPIPDSLRAHLSIPEDQGILVHMVTKDSPADKAGIRQHDILLEAGGKALKSPEDLVSVVRDMKDQSFEIKLLRKGKTESVTIQGEPRPTQTEESIPAFPGPFASPEAWQKWFDWFHKQLPNQPPLTFRFYRPGIVLPPGEAEDWPKDLTIIVTKQGSEPSKIVVRRGDKTWEVTEKELDKLPKEIRPYVERMIRGNRGTLGGVLEVTPFGKPVPPKDLEKNILKPVRPWSATEAERLDKLEKQLDELKKRLDALQKKESSEKN